MDVTAGFEFIPDRPVLAIFRKIATEDSRGQWMNLNMTWSDSPDVDCGFKPTIVWLFQTASALPDGKCLTIVPAA